MKEFQIFGPPGTGKTTRTASWIRQAVERYGAANVIACSFTRAAATELVSRDLPLLPQNVGTLHALCYRMLDRPVVVETKKYLEEWNKVNAGRRDWQLTGGVEDVEDAAPDDAPELEGDKMFHFVQTLRARMIPLDLWPVSAVQFWNRWQAWKNEVQGVDFTDLIDLVYHDFSFFPGIPAVGFFDEVQDFTALETSTIRKLAKLMQFIVMAGDDDQSLYRFKGATIEAFLSSDVAVENKTFLEQSYRVPRAVHAVADAWIRRVSRREPKVYLPKDAPGRVLRYAAGNEGDGRTYKHPERLVEDAMRHVDDGRTVMFLAACSYMLEPLKVHLRREGLPFHNPYRTNRRDWNPLAPARGVSTADRIGAFLRPQSAVWGEDARMWTATDLQQWLEIVKADGVLRYGMKAAIDKMTGTEPIEDIMLLMSFFEEAAFNPALDGDLEWLAAHLLASKAKVTEYPLAVARARGAKALQEEPKLMLGTVHSVKGGEADTVVVFPDLSSAGVGEWNHTGERRDSVLRQFYVAFTRAKEELILAAPSGPAAVVFPPAPVELAV